jgi:cytochrome c oxidase subunit II
MPLLVRRRLLVALLVVGVVALAAAGVAAAANGGFTPESPHSPNVHNTNTAYYVILGFTSAIFLIVETALVVFIVKYRARRRPRTAEGVQLHGHTRLEIIWTVIPVVILAVIGTVVFIELPGISGAPASAANKLEITVEGHQFYWQFDYPNGARSINDLYVPVGQVVELKVVSADVVHSWWIPQLEGKIQAIPGRTNHTWFRADRTGTFYGECAELCGPFHAQMKARVIATSQADYQTFITQRAAQNLGKAEFTGVCATCHGMQGEGGYGPALASNSLLTQAKGLEAIVRNGRGLMPPVGNTWTDEQLKALAAYTSKHVFKGASTSGG